MMASFAFLQKVSMEQNWPKYDFLYIASMLLGEMLLGALIIAKHG
jgi:hypothetical protein